MYVFVEEKKIRRFETSWWNSESSFIKVFIQPSNVKCIWIQHVTFCHVHSEQTNPIIIFRNMTIRKHEENILWKNDAINRLYAKCCILLYAALICSALPMKFIPFPFSTFVYIYFVKFSIALNSMFLSDSIFAFVILIWLSTL